MTKKDMDSESNKMLVWCSIKLKLKLASQEG